MDRNRTELLIIGLNMSGWKQARWYPRTKVRAFTNPEEEKKFFVSAWGCLRLGWSHYTALKCTEAIAEPILEAGRNAERVARKNRKLRDDINEWLRIVEAPPATKFTKEDRVKEIVKRLREKDDKSNEEEK